MWDSFRNTWFHSLWGVHGFIHSLLYTVCWIIVTKYVILCQVIANNGCLWTHIVYCPYKSILHRWSHILYCLCETMFLLPGWSHILYYLQWSLLPVWSHKLYYLSEAIYCYYLDEAIYCITCLKPYIVLPGWGHILYYLDEAIWRQFVRFHPRSTKLRMQNNHIEFRWLWKQ